MRQSKPINWFKLIIRFLALLALLCCIPFLALTFIVLLDFGGFIIAPALTVYFAYSTISLFGKVTPDRLKRFAFTIGLLLWMLIGYPIFLLFERAYPQMLAFMMFLILPLAVIGFYLLLSRILLYFAEKQGNNTKKTMDEMIWKEIREKQL